jgi:hypothetical protein
MKQTTLSFEEENKKIKYKKKRTKALKEQRERVRSACCALDNAECRLKLFEEQRQKYGSTEEEAYPRIPSEAELKDLHPVYEREAKWLEELTEPWELEELERRIDMQRETRRAER